MSPAPHLDVARFRADATRGMFRGMKARCAPYGFTRDFHEYLTNLLEWGQLTPEKAALILNKNPGIRQAYEVKK